MNINAPVSAQIPQLKRLWQQAFGDPMAFIDGFFRTGFSPERCRCLTLDGSVAAALYWFDGEENGRFAYIYAVATEASHRGKGLCRALMENTHRHLAAQGYAGAVLVPAESHLWDYYGSMGYRPFGSIRHFAVQAENPAFSLQEITAESYIALRKDYLSANAMQEDQAIGFYDTWGKFYEGKDCLFAAATDGELLYVQEFLGNPDRAPGAVAALGCTRGQFRTPGAEENCGMYLLFSQGSPPGYLGFPLD